MRSPSGRSHAGWSAVGHSPAQPIGEDGEHDEHPFAADERERYDELDLIGEGGMGTVVAAHDRRLGREVALKTVNHVATNAAASQRLAREAWITARLEHPGIVPVHDAGTTADGTPFYTMRLVRGRSLAHALADASTADARLGLLRNYLAACHAVAFAHAHRVVHRDLKPANIMVGEHGETVVVDWGLAVSLDEPDAATVSSGTPAYMSPEQVNGARPATTDDVWALGVILGELLSVPGSRGLELTAIQAKACAADPNERFIDAAALSADVAAYLDGRRVGAHQYSTLELLRRVVRAWRIPLAIGALGLVVAAVVFAVTWRRVLGERARAVAAETSTKAALVEMRAALASTLEGQARAAFATSALPEAEVLAATLLELGESADARGILAAAYAAERPGAGSFWRPLGCERVLAARGDRAVCSSASELLLVGPDGPIWRRARQAAAVVMTADGRVGVLGAPSGLALLDERGDVLVEAGLGPLPMPTHGLHRSPDDRWLVAGTSAHEVVVLDTVTRTIGMTGRECSPAGLTAIAVATHTLVLACADGRVQTRSLPLGAPPTWFTLPGAAGDRGPMAAAFADEDTALIGTVDGGVWRIELATGQLGEPRSVGSGAIDSLHVVGDGVLVAFDDRGPALWTLERGLEHLRLPSSANRRYDVDGDSIIAVGDGVWRWSLSTRRAPRTLASPSGLSAVAVSPDGTLLAVARGDGHVTVYARKDGTVVADLDASDAVIKHVAFSPDGRRLAFAIASTDAVRIAEVGTWAVTAATSSVSSRRVFFLPDGTLVAVPYGPDLDTWTTDGRHGHPSAPTALDAYVAPDSATMWMITRDDRIVRWDERGIEDVGGAHGATTIAASRDGALVVVAGGRTLRVLEPATGVTRVVRIAAGEVEHVIVSRDGRWFAVGTATGIIEVWRPDGASPRARLRGHHQRNAGFALGHADELVSSSWDGTASVWDLGVLDRDGDTLVEAARAVWGSEVLSLP